MKPGGPYELVAQHILGRRNVTQRVHDVLFGDVWLCSGQSNMQMTVSQVICRVSVKINSVDVEEEEKKWREEGARRREREKPFYHVPGVLAFPSWAEGRS